MQKKILVVDDERDLRQLIKDYLEQEGFAVLTAANGRDALIVAQHEQPDLVLLDIMMPQLNGYEFMRIFSGRSDTPVIMLTAKVAEGDKVLGLELGADDYVTKPFSMRELAARVRAVLRRMEKGAGRERDEILRSGVVNRPKSPHTTLPEIELNRTSHIVKVRGERIDLTPSEFDILALLIASPGRTWSRLDLLEKIQDTTYIGYERTIDVHIRHLRQKIERDPADPHLIETVYGFGYRFWAGD